MQSVGFDNIQVRPERQVLFFSATWHAPLATSPQRLSQTKCTPSRSAEVQMLAGGLCHQQARYLKFICQLKLADMVFSMLPGLCGFPPAKRKFSTQPVHGPNSFCYKTVLKKQSCRRLPGSMYDAANLVARLRNLEQSGQLH